MSKELTTEFVLEAWGVLKEYIPSKQRFDAAVALIKSLDSDFDSDDYDDIKGEDQYLDLAVETVFELEHEKDDNDDEDY